MHVSAKSLVFKTRIICQYRRTVRKTLKKKNAVPLSFPPRIPPRQKSSVEFRTGLSKASSAIDIRWARDKMFDVWSNIKHQLSEARSRLYGQLRQREQAHFSAFFEIYKMCILLHRSKFRNLAKFCQNFVKILLIFMNKRSNFAIFPPKSSFFAPILIKICRNFTKFQEIF